jgi:hypothetical protein
MRIMEIPPFPQGAATEMEDFGSLIRKRIAGNVAPYRDQSIKLIAYMAWPHDEIARWGWMRMHVSSVPSKIRDDQADPAPREATELNLHWAAAASPNIFFKNLKLIQQHWARTADILNHHYDLGQGGHQSRRGGASVGKVLHLMDEKATAKGTGVSAGAIIPH